MNRIWNSGIQEAYKYFLVSINGYVGGTRRVFLMDMQSVVMD